MTRFLIPEDDRTLKGAMAYSVVFQSFIYVCATLIAIASGVLLPDLDQPDLTLPALVAKLLPPVFGGIIIAAVLSAIMSTLPGSSWSRAPWWWRTSTSSSSEEPSTRLEVYGSRDG